jgi:mannosylglycoprotein endo-beta-mannosidase
LRKWSSQSIGDLKLRAAITSELIRGLDSAMDRRNLTEPERRFRNSLKLNLLGIAALQRSHWRQRSRMAWLKEGDANTGFFHAKASAKRRKRLVLSFRKNDQIITGHDEKMEYIHEYFMSMIGTRNQRTHTQVSGTRHPTVTATRIGDRVHRGGSKSMCV